MIRRHAGWLRDPASVVLAGSTVVSVVVPSAAWTGLWPPLQPWWVAAFVLSVPGTSIVLAILGRWQGLWVGLAPVVSVACALISCTTLFILNAGWVPLPLSLAALLHLTALPRAAAALRCDPFPPGMAQSCVNRLVVLALQVAAVSLWWWSTRRLRLDEADALGILNIAPWQYWAAVGIVALSLAWVLSRPTVDRLLAGTGLATLVLVVTAFVSVTDGTPSVPTTFVHLGIIDAIQSLGFLPQAIDARFSWPAFFITAADFFEVADLSNPVPLTVGYPVVVGWLSIPPMVVLGRSVGGSERAGWIAAAVLVCAVWMQQDYFSPQSIAFLILLNVLAVLAAELCVSDVPATTGPWWMRLARLPGRLPGRAPGWGIRRTLAVEFLLLGLAAAIVPAHQLTPLALIAVLAGLSSAGVTRHRTLWLGLAVVFLAWFAFGATDWWTGHLASVLADVGQVQESIARGAVDRVAGDPWYARMQLGRVAWSGLLAVGAGLGWLAVRRRPMGTFAAVALVAPGLIVGLQTYGGEVVLRAFLYTAPMIAALVGTAVAFAVDRSAGIRSILSGTALILLTVGVSVTRNVNVAFERTPPDVLDAARWVLAEAPPRARISPARAEAVLQQSRFREVDSPQGVGCDRTPLECILRQGPDIVFLTRTRDRFDELREGGLPDFSRQLAHQLEVSGRYRVTRSSSNVVVLQREDSSLKKAPSP